jgi:hypothetical protein
MSKMGYDIHTPKAVTVVATYTAEDVEKMGASLIDQPTDDDLPSLIVSLIGESRGEHY